MLDREYFMDVIKDRLIRKIRMEVGKHPSSKFIIVLNGKLLKNEVTVDGSLRNNIVSARFNEDGVDTKFGFDMIYFKSVNKHSFVVVNEMLDVIASKLMVGDNYGVDIGNCLNYTDFELASDDNLKMIFINSAEYLKVKELVTAPSVFKSLSLKPDSVNLEARIEKLEGEAFTYRTSIINKESTFRVELSDDNDNKTISTATITPEDKQTLSRFFLETCYANYIEIGAMLEKRLKEFRNNEQLLFYNSLCLDLGKSGASLYTYVPAFLTNVHIFNPFLDFGLNRLIIMKNPEYYLIDDNYVKVGTVLVRYLTQLEINKWFNHKNFTGFTWKMFNELLIDYLNGRNKFVYMLTEARTRRTRTGAIPDVIDGRETIISDHQWESLADHIKLLYEEMPLKNLI
ncbi:MAG: hypothetical protein RSG07_06230, partial [Erysipelotrichaceae bacterium]